MKILSLSSSVNQVINIFSKACNTTAILYITNHYLRNILGVLKFFGHMANWKPIELLSKYPKFFDRLFSNIESGDLTIVAVSLDTLGIIGLTNTGKCALQSTGMINCFTFY